MDIFENPHFDRWVIPLLPTALLLDWLGIAMSATISTVSTTITPSALSSTADSEGKTHTLTSTEIAVIVSVATVFLILLILVCVIVLRRSHRQKYEHPEDGSKSVDAVESSLASKPSKDDLHSTFKRAEADPFIITETEQRLPPSESRYFKDAYTRPSSSVKNYYEGLATHETHIVSLDTAQSPKDNVGFETVALHSGRSSSSKSTIKLTPLSIPEKSLYHSNGERSTKRAVSRKSSKPTDSGWETENDSASLYSVASASASNYFSNSSLETIKPPPVPPIPIQFTSPIQSTLPKGTDTIVRRDEENLITKSPPLLSPSLPSLKFNEDNGVEVEEDETQIYNVAKLLHSRQSRVPDAPSRSSSIVSHIERSGSIRPISLTNEESYRPRYYRLKQKRDTKDSYTPNLSPTHIPESPNM